MIRILLAFHGVAQAQSFFFRSAIDVSGCGCVVLCSVKLSLCLPYLVNKTSCYLNCVASYHYTIEMCYVNSRLKKIRSMLGLRTGKD